MTLLRLVSAEGATAPETLRQTDRCGDEALESRRFSFNHLTEDVTQVIISI